MTMVPLLVITLLSGSVSQPATPLPLRLRQRAPQADAEEAAARAGRLFEAGEYEEAARAFEAAHAETGDPVFLYSAGIALEKAGDCVGAIEAFERFRGTGPDAQDDAAAAEKIETCRASREPAVEPASPPPPAVDPPPVEPQVTPSRPFDRTSVVLVAGGGVFVVAGAALYASSFVALRPRTRTESAFERDASRSRALAISGITVASVGAAVILGGVVRWLVRRSVNRTPAEPR
ncbi:MAG: hypothetical protein AAGA54_31740 [Myxococcota bacterium]